MIKLADKIKFVLNVVIIYFIISFIVTNLVGFVSSGLSIETFVDNINLFFFTLSESPGPFIIMALLIPIIVSIFFGFKILNEKNPLTIKWKMPLISAVISILLLIFPILDIFNKYNTMIYKFENSSNKENLGLASIMLFVMGYLFVILVCFMINCISSYIISLKLLKKLNIK